MTFTCAHSHWDDPSPLRLVNLLKHLAISLKSESSIIYPCVNVIMALDNFYHNKIESLKLEIIQGQAVLRRLEAQRNDYNSRVRLLREELGLLQQPGSYVGEVVKVMGTKKVLVKVHPEGKYGTLNLSLVAQRIVLTCRKSWTLPTMSTSQNSQWVKECRYYQIRTSSRRCYHRPLILLFRS
jgi:hypothetical protein